MAITPVQKQMMVYLDSALADKNERKEAIEKAIKLGAKTANEQYGGEDWVTMLDPAGYPYCFVVWNHSFHRSPLPTNRPLVKQHHIVVISYNNYESKVF